MDVSGFAQIDVSWRSALLFGLLTPLWTASLVLMLRSIESLASKLLAFMLLLYSMNLIPQIIGFSGAYQIWPNLTFAPFTFELWLGPLLYFHIHTLTTSEPLRYKRYFVIPGVMQTMYYVWAFTWFDDHLAKWAYNDSVHVPYVVPIETAAGLVLTLSCMWLCYRQIKRYRQHLLETQSDLEPFNPVWLSACLNAAMASYGIWIGFELVSLTVGGLGYTNQYPVHLILTILMIALGMLAIARITEAYPKISGSEPAVTAEQSDHEFEKLANALNARMRSEQWFLQPRLNIGQVARSMGSNDSYLSRALNQVLATNFNQWVNEFRVEYAADALRSESQMALLDIAYAAGFSSKASFNRLFKQFKGLTPSQYREQKVEIAESF